MAQHYFQIYIFFRVVDNCLSFCPFFLFLLVIVLAFLSRFRASGDPFRIFNFCSYIGRIGDLGQLLRYGFVIIIANHIMFQSKYFTQTEKYIN
jgi:hypothetical protein